MVLSNEDFQQLAGLFDIKLSPITRQLGAIEADSKQWRVGWIQWRTDWIR